MNNLFLLLLIVSAVGIWYFIKKEPNRKYKNYSIIALVVFFILFGVTSPDSNTDESGKEATVSNKNESSKKDSEKEAAAAAEKEKLAAEKEAAAEAEKLAAEKEAAAEAEKLAAELGNRDNYNTGITYDQLARTPDEFKGQRVKFYGKVIQVMEGDENIQLRVAVDDNYDTIAYVEYLPSIVTQRVLEDDMITFYGTAAGLITYNSTMGGKISIPGVLASIIDFN
ncbi:transcriptional regulator [Carnobacterium maltaromaticum]|uniref:transcriptional regulator n=1 Tax=Carnobacterium maltaromaticum TaxID=2751 RepID=UPI0039BE9AE7